MKLINWVVLVLGLWILLSPFVLAFSGLSSAMWSNVISGVLVVILALWSLFGGNSGDSSSSAMPQ
ncbi:MAG: SPW repeat protein [Patescibacteria group bacterium]